MNRRITGIVAWCALGLVVAIPSTDVLLNNIGGNRADVAQNESSKAQEVLGPKLTGDNDRPTIDMSSDDFSSVLQPPLTEADAPVSVVAEVEEPLPSREALPAIVPLGAPPAEKVEIAAAPETEIVPIAPLDAGQSDYAAEMDPDQPLIEQDITIASIDPTAVSESAVEAAPVPQPAPVRPSAATTTHSRRLDGNRPLPTLEDDVRSSVNVIETSRRPAVVLDEPVNEPFFGDNPRYRTGRRLDTFSSEEIARTDDASDSQFYELWARENRPSGFQRRGSFSEQLPARRGSAVRLDLLQNN